jgi:hypothetical protein
MLGNNLFLFDFGFVLFPRFGKQPTSRVSANGSGFETEEDSEERDFTFSRR